MAETWQTNKENAMAGCSFHPKAPQIKMVDRIPFGPPGPDAPSRLVPVCAACLQEGQERRFGPKAEHEQSCRYVRRDGDCNCSHGYVEGYIP